VADSAVGRLRGILAASMTRADIDHLLFFVAAEQAADRPIPYTLADPAEQPAVPVRPTPRLIRELVEGAATQGEHCPERTRTREGRIVTCAKAAAHHGSWHRNGRDIWKVTHIAARDQREDDHAPHDTPHPRPLHRVVAELRTALRAIASGAPGCPCRSADVAQEALAVTDAPRT
jgi:hypothetical protein